jgi:Protein of unknown function (DUF2975)
MAMAQTVEPLPHAALRARIAWLCHLTRAAAVGWAVWVLIAVVWTWSDPAKIASILGHYLNADLGAISPSEFAWACGVNIAAWIADAAVAYCIWRLFGTYLGGRIFTGDAAAWLRRLGLAGLIAVLVSIVGRRILWLILSSHAELALSTRLFTQLVVPGDLLGVLFCLFVLAIGHVFRTAVEIADDYARIV